MFEIIMPTAWQQDFLAFSARYAARPVSVSVNGDSLRLRGLSAAQTAAALTGSVLERYEQEQLRALLQRCYGCFDSSEQEQILALSRALLDEEPCRGRIYSGPRRREHLARHLCCSLQQGPLHLLGWCRFRLPGYQQYLRYILERAADQLLAEQEQQQYLRLLRRAAAPLGRDLTLHLFFCPPDRFNLWQQGAEGLRELEGGRYHSAALLSGLICYRPACLQLHNAHFAPAQLLDGLIEVFEERLQFS